MPLSPMPSHCPSGPHSQPLARKLWNRRSWLRLWTLPLFRHQPPTPTLVAAEEPQPIVPTDQHSWLWCGTSWGTRISTCKVTPSCTWDRRPHPELVGQCEQKDCVWINHRVKLTAHYHYKPQTPTPRPSSSEADTFPGHLARKPSSPASSNLMPIKVFTS